MVYKKHFDEKEQNLHPYSSLPQSSQSSCPEISTSHLYGFFWLLSTSLVPVILYQT